MLLDALEAFLAFRAGQHLFQKQHILKAVDHPGVGRQAVTAGTAGFLIVRLDRFGQVQVGNKAHVGFVDTHAKGDGGDHDQAFFVDEALLVKSAQFVVQPGMVGQGAVALFRQVGGGTFHALARQAIDNA